MSNEQIRYLLDRYLSGEITEKEQQQLAALLQDADYEQIIQGEIMQDLQATDGEPVADRGAYAMLQRVLAVDKTMGEESGGLPVGGDDASERMGRVMGEEPKGLLVDFRRAAWRWSAAAVFFFAFAGAGYFFFYKNKTAALQATPHVYSMARIVPGSSQAVLTLANGQQIVLTNAQNGVLSRQGLTKVVKQDSGLLAYDVKDADGGNGAEGSRGNGRNGANGGTADERSGGTGDNVNGKTLYNTLATPRGGQYQVCLPDGTRVWLNAESSLRYPTAFTGKDREVQLTGEAYFEVAADKNRPFLVRAGSTETRVLGTHFNIMSYEDEGPVRTTLLEGAVRMEQGTYSALLQPGEQAQPDNEKGGIATRLVNTRAVVAWKDGYYYFDRTPVQSVMRQIARWYDVDIVYQGAAPTDEIVGKIPRTAYVSEVLHIMELIGIRFKIEGRKIIVLS